MNDSFVCKTSQVKNIIPFIITLLLSVLMFYFETSIINKIDDFLYFLSGFFEIPEFESSIIYNILFGLIISIFGWKVLVVKNTYYLFEDERIIMYYGVINKDYDNLEYYRIKDYKITQPLIANIFNLHNMLLISTDRTHPRVNFKYITNFENREPMFRNQIKNATSTGRGREIDVV